MAVEVHRIEKEFIFKSLIEASFEVDIHGPGFRTKARITEHDEREVRLEIVGAPVKPADRTRINVYFAFREQPMTFSTVVVEAKDATLVLRQPKEIYRDLSRDFERVYAPPGLTVTLTVEGEELIMSFPDSEQYEPVEEPQVATNFDAVKIGDLLKAFRERAAEYADENKIVMFRERRPESRCENLVSLSGRVLVLPLWKLKDGDSQLVRQRVLTRERVRGVAEAYGEDPDTVEAELNTLVASNRTRHVRYEMYCPVLYHQYVVGYMYLIRTDASKGGFSDQSVEFAVQFARILSYSLKVNGYFAGRERRDEITDAEVIDISGSGILLSFPKEKVAPVIFTDVELRIRLDGQDIEAKGTVARRFSDADRIYVGVRFTRMDHVDKVELLERLYGHSE